MIECKNLSFSYGRRKRPVLHDFSLEIPEGGVYGLLGKNGAGKSTLLYLIMGLLNPASGCVLCNGTDTRKRPPTVMGDMFMVPEEFELPDVHLSTYVRLNSVFYPRFSTEDLRCYLSLFDMVPDVHLKELSMGQKKKVLMCFALATNTSVLLMDEPTNGLDIPGKSQFRKFVAAGMSETRTLLISTHQVRDVERLLDRVVVIEDSRVLLDAPMETIGQRLAFTETTDRHLAERAYSCLPSPQGYQVMLPAEGKETAVNLELLFNGLLDHPEEIAGLFGEISKK